MNDNISDFVQKRLAEKKLPSEGMSLEEEERLWRANIDCLYGLVKESFAEFLKVGAITLTLAEMQLYEEQLGTYTVTSATVTLGDTIVKLTPIGTFLIVARGRVDMEGPRGITRFVVVPPSSSGPSLRVTSPMHAGAEQNAVPAVSPKDWVWMIATPPPRISYLDLTPDSFRDEFMRVVNG